MQDEFHLITAVIPFESLEESYLCGIITTNTCTTISERKQKFRNNTSALHQSNYIHVQTKLLCCFKRVKKTHVCCQIDAKAVQLCIQILIHFNAYFKSTRTAESL